MSFPHGQQRALIKSAYTEQAAHPSKAIGRRATTLKHRKPTQESSSDSTFPSPVARLSAPAVKMYASSSTGSSEGHKSELLQKEEGRKNPDRTAVTDGVRKENLVWVVKPPVRIRRRETAGKRDRGNGGIKVKVRLLAADVAQKKKPRTPEYTKSPTVRPAGTSCFKVYQVQRRGEQSAKLVTERTITEDFKSVCQQPIIHEKRPPPRTATTQSIEGREPRVYSEVFPQMKTSRSAAETAGGDAYMRSAVFDIQPGRHAEGQHIGIEKEGRGEKPNKACGTVTAHISSSFSAVPSSSRPVAVRGVNGNQLRGQPPDERHSATPCGKAFESSSWPTHNLSQHADSEISGRVPLVAQQYSQSRTWVNKNLGPSPSSIDSLPSLHRVASHHSSSSCSPIAGKSGSFQNVQKLCYWQPGENDVLAPALRRLPSPTPSGPAKGDTLKQEPDTNEDSQPYLVRCSCCATDLTETCGDWCERKTDTEGIKNGFEMHAGISRQMNVEGWQTSKGGIPQRAPQQRSILQRIFNFGSTTTFQAGDRVEASMSKEGAVDGRAEAPHPAALQQSPPQKASSVEKTPSTRHTCDNMKLLVEAERPFGGDSASVQRTTSTTELPKDSPQRLESTTEKTEYAVFLPRRMRQEELRKDDEVPVIFRLLHRRTSKPRRAPPKGVSLPRTPEASTGQPVSKQAFHFRVLQQQQAKDDEKRRIVAFKAPRHCRAATVATVYDSKRHFGTPGSFESSDFCASSCGEPPARRLSSGSSTSSLITLQYSQRRSYVSLPRVPVREVQRAPDQFLSKVTVSPFAARVAQETIRRVARRRAAQRARAQAAQKQAEDSHEVCTRPGEPKRLENGAGTSSDMSWCCAVRDECRAPQMSSADEETATLSPSTSSINIETVQETKIPSTYRETDAEFGTSAGESQAAQVEATGEVVSALRTGGLCKKVGDWLMWGSLGRKGDASEEPQTERSSQQNADAVKYVRGFEGADDSPSEPARPQPGVISLSQCCGPRINEESILPDDASSVSYTSAGATPSVATYTETVEGMPSPRPEMDHLRTASGVVTAPLYSLPVVSFLPPIVEPLPVVETVAVNTPLQLPVCCFAVPPCSSHTHVQEAAVGQVHTAVVNDPSPQVPALPERVKIYILPSRQFVAHA